MEWTKDELTNMFVLCLSKQHAERILKYFLKYEIDSLQIEWKVGDLMGVVKFSHGYKVTKVTNIFRTQLKLSTKPRRKFPRDMMVSINGVEWFKRRVFGKVKALNPFIIPVFENDTQGKILMGIKYAKEIN
jgi:hypothetical protein